MGMPLGFRWVESFDVLAAELLDLSERPDESWLKSFAFG